MSRPCLARAGLTEPRRVAVGLLGLLSVGGCRDLKTKFLREVTALGLPAAPPSSPVIGPATLASLPPAARRYMTFMNVGGRPRDWSFRARLDGRFRRGPTEPWRTVEVWQYDTRLDLARLFYMRLSMFGVPILGRDTYVAGRGRMLVRPFDLFTVQDARGPELDVGELVTYLNDAILLAPSLLLGPEASWRAVDDDTFDVSLTDHGTTVRARVSVDGHGAPIDFSTTDRFVEDPRDPRRPLVRARWTTPISGWQVIDGRPIPTTGQAIWHLPGLEFAYAELRFVGADLAFNVPPGQ